MPSTKPARAERTATSEHLARTDCDKNLITKRNAGKGGKKTAPQAKGGATRTRTSGRRSGSKSNAS